MACADEKRGEELIVSPEWILERIEPGMSIFLGTAMAEPRTLVEHLMTTEGGLLCWNK